MPRAATAMEVYVLLTPEQLALVFCEFSHEEQAEFFNAIGRHAAVWPRDSGGASMQWWRVGRFLREHAKTTHEGRRVVLDMAEGLAE